ncbi:MAG: T9SS C-terminal target domain-containing protein [Methanobacteriota archaeon]|nr:MAG: T9SS C-terminal target domain-containing protein [Euryarchaeota archaeon]
MRVIIFIFSVCLTSLVHLQAQSLSGTYTVGGSNPDFSTVQEAADALIANGVSGPVNLNIRPGTYEENGGADRVIYLDQQISGASQMNPVTFQPDVASGGNVDNVILRRIVGSYEEKGWIAEIRSSGITLNELTIEYADTSTAGYHPNSTFAPVHIEKGPESSQINDVTISGCKIIRTSTVQRSPQGINVIGQATRINIVGNIIDGSKDGIVMSGYGPRRRILVSDNTITGLRTHFNAVSSLYGSGIEIWTGQDSTVVRNNIIDYRNYGYGVFGIYFPGYSERIFIEGNQILWGQNDYWNHRRFTGIHVTTGYGQTTIRNNMIASRSPGTVIEIYASDCQIYNNTVIQTSAALNGQEDGNVFYMDGTGNSVLNNIFIEQCAGQNVGPVMEITDTTGNRIDYNCLYKAQNDGRFVKANGVTHASITTWQASGNGLHSISKSPEFKDVLLDLHLGGCSVYDPELQAALPLSAVAVDIDGETRDPQTPFFGADEAGGEIPDIFSPVSMTPTEDEALHFTAADLDGDGDTDLAVVNRSGSTGDVSLFWNDGQANFSGPNHIAFGSQPEVIGAADIDGDNSVDLIATSDGSLSVRYGNPGGTFDAVTNFPYQRDVDGFLLIDLNNDNNHDIFQTHAGIVGVDSGAVTQLINLGGRNFAFANQGSFDAGQYPSSVASGYINGDNFLDVVTVDFVNGRVSVLLNLGIDPNNGIWLGFASAGNYQVSSGSSPLHANLSVGDIDGDNDADILVGEWGVTSDSLALLRNNGDGTFAPKEDFFINDTRYSETFTVFDYEGDGDLDLVAATQRHDLVFLRNDGVGNFEQFLLCQNSDFGSEPLTLVTAPFDGNATLDVAVLTIDDDIAVMLNQNYTTGIPPEEPGPGLVESFRLDQNYPNPFNPVTNIQFSVISKQFVVLKVFDLLGREVKTLMEKNLSAGEYKVQWDGRNDAGILVASGMYLYRLTAGTQYIKTKKLILLR